MGGNGEEVEGYVWESVAVAGSGWQRQGRAAKAVVAGGQLGI